MRNSRLHERRRARVDQVSATRAQVSLPHEETLPDSLRLDSSDLDYPSLLVNRNALYLSL
jgi:hypothetical protein